MQPPAESHDALIQPGGHTDGSTGGGGGEGGRPDVPDQESQWGAPPHLAGDGVPAQCLSQQQERGAPAGPAGFAHAAGACAAVRLLSQSQAVHRGSPQQAASHDPWSAAHSCRRSQPRMFALAGGDGDGHDGGGTLHLSPQPELFTMG